MLKEKLTKTKKFSVALMFLLFVLAVSNICLAINYSKASKEDKIIEEIEFVPTKEGYNEDTKYYATLNYKNFKKLYKKDELITVAVLDNSTNTSVMFKKMINKIAYYNNTKIYLLELNKLTRKDEIAFLDIDERFSKLESNYFVTFQSGKILSITEFDRDQLIKIVEGLGE